MTWKKLLSLTIIAVMAVSLIGLTGTEEASASSGKLRGKRVLIEGDSIQAGYGRYLERSLRRLGARKITNDSVSLSTLAWNPGSYSNNRSVWYRVRKMTKKQLSRYDYVFIAAGTNDWSGIGDVAPGTLNSTNARTLCGGLNKTIQHIRKLSPKTRIVIITPIHRCKDLSGSSRPKNCNKVCNRYGKTLHHYRIYMTAVARSYPNVSVVQGYRISRISEMASKSNSRDYLHPTPRYAKKVLVKRAVPLIRRSLK